VSAKVMSWEGISVNSEVRTRGELGKTGILLLRVWGEAIPFSSAFICKELPKRTGRLWGVPGGRAAGA